MLTRDTLADTGRCLEALARVQEDAWYTNHRSRPPFNLTPAIQHFGLRWPVSVSYSNWQAGGAYLCDRDLPQDQHHIRIQPGLGPEWTSACLWHELTHALQAERHGSPWSFWRAFENEITSLQMSATHEDRVRGYSTIECEVEAMASMVLHFDVGTLVPLP